MNREILFRGQRLDNDEWAYGDLLHLPNGDVVILSDKGYTKVKPKTIGQFTGLTDKNGNKIFEGDIVHGYWNTKFLIFFDLCCLQFRAKLSDGTEKDIDYYGDSKKIEVIGNIYDSPELLRSENE